MRILIDALKVSHLPWPETLVLQSKEKIDVDPQDGKSLLRRTRQMLICRFATRDGFVSWATQGSLCAETDDIATRLRLNKSQLLEN